MDSIVGFDVGGKNDKICHSWAVPAIGTGTKQGWYRYHLCSGKMVPIPNKVVPVPLTKIGFVLILIQVVSIPLLLATLIFGILTLLSSNSHTEGIRTLINY